MSAILAFECVDWLGKIGTKEWEGDFARVLGVWSKWLGQLRRRPESRSQNATGHNNRSRVPAPPKARPPRRAELARRPESGVCGTTLWGLYRPLREILERAYAR